VRKGGGMNHRITAGPSGQEIVEILQMLITLPVEPHDGVAALRQMRNHLLADAAGVAGDKNSHALCRLETNERPATTWPSDRRQPAGTGQTP
jgi:hypothetical protein